MDVSLRSNRSNPVTISVDKTNSSTGNIAHSTRTRYPLITSASVDPELPRRKVLRMSVGSLPSSESSLSSSLSSLSSHDVLSAGYEGTVLGNVPDHITDSNNNSNNNDINEIDNKSLCDIVVENQQFETKDEGLRRPAAVTCTSEILSPDERENIERNGVCDRSETTEDTPLGPAAVLLSSELCRLSEGSDVCETEQKDDAPPDAAAATDGQQKAVDVYNGQGADISKPASVLLANASSEYSEPVDTIANGSNELQVNSTR